MRTTTHAAEPENQQASAIEAAFELGRACGRTEARLELAQALLREARDEAEAEAGDES